MLWVRASTRKKTTSQPKSPRPPAARRPAAAPRPSTAPTGGSICAPAGALVMSRAANDRLAPLPPARALTKFWLIILEGTGAMAATSSSPLRYRRLLLKLSGEALMGTGGYGIDMRVVQRLALDIKEAVVAGAEIAAVVGGGNIFRGLAGVAKGMDRATGDYMGMLATVK